MINFTIVSQTFLISKAGEVPIGQSWATVQQASDLGELLINSRIVHIPEDIESMLQIINEVEMDNQYWTNIFGEYISTNDLNTIGMIATKNTIIEPSWGNTVNEYMKSHDVQLDKFVPADNLHRIIDELAEYVKNNSISNQKENE
jgi:hypothetical protein